MCELDDVALNNATVRYVFCFLKINDVASDRAEGRCAPVPIRS